MAAKMLKQRAESRACHNLHFWTRLDIQINKKKSSFAIFNTRITTQHNECTHTPHSHSIQIGLDWSMMHNEASSVSTKVVNFNLNT